MRHHRRIAILAAVIALIATFTAPTVEAGGVVGLHLSGGGFGVSVGFGDWGVYTGSWADPRWSLDFNASLAGYGQWIWVEGLGRVWRPWVATAWRPYTHGRWVSTGCGMTWVSYEPWGYIPHHYGSWAYCSFGWAWVPGYSYSCANVVWVRGGGYVGWYARPPRGWSHSAHGFRHGYRHGYRDGFGDGYGSGYSDGWHDARYGTYVAWRDFATENVSGRRVSHRIASRTPLDVRANAPTTAEIRRRIGRPMPETRLSRRTVRVDGREITIARPDGMASSIERHAARTVGRALSPEARERRQPLVSPRTVSTEEGGSARSDGVTRGSRSRSEPPPERSSSSRTRGSDAAARSTFDRPTTTGPSRDGRRQLPVDRNDWDRRWRNDDGRSTPRSGVASGASRSQRRETPSRSVRSQPSSARQRPAPSTRGTDVSKNWERRTESASRRAAPAQQRANSSRRSPSGSGDSKKARQRTNDRDKQTTDTSPKRNR